MIACLILAKHNQESDHTKYDIKIHSLLWTYTFTQKNTSIDDKQSEGSLDPLRTMTKVHKSCFSSQISMHIHYDNHIRFRQGRVLVISCGCRLTMQVDIPLQRLVQFSREIRSPSTPTTLLLGV